MAVGFMPFGVATSSWALDYLLLPRRTRRTNECAYHESFLKPEIQTSGNKYMKKLQLSATTVLAVCCMALTPVSPIWAAPVLDQDHNGTGAFQPMSPGEVWTQTFVPGITGALTQVNLAITTLSDPFSVPGDLTISIRDTSLGSAYISNGFDYSNTAIRTIPTHTDLATASVLAADIPDFFVGGPALQITFALPAQVTTGHTYAIVVQSGGTARHAWSVALTTNVDSYVDGTMFTDFGTGTSWYDYGVQPSPSTSSTDYIDAQFQTFVDATFAAVPEPASVLLFLAGLPLLMAHARRVNNPRGMRELRSSSRVILPALADNRA
jgi:hypothetical protein